MYDHSFIGFVLLSSRTIWGSTFETGNYMELTRVDNFYILGFPVSKPVLRSSYRPVSWADLQGQPSVWSGKVPPAYLPLQRYRWYVYHYGTLVEPQMGRVEVKAAALRDI